MIEGLFENPESIFDTEHFFGVKCEESDLPFSNEELQLILRELAIGIYAHDTVPFFSLEFNDLGHLFPAIHPVYEKTLFQLVIDFCNHFNDRFEGPPDDYPKDAARFGIDWLEDMRKHPEKHQTEWKMWDYWIHEVLHEGLKAYGSFSGEEW